MDSTSRPSLFQRYMNGSLVLQIIIGIVCGIAIASFSPSAAQSAGLNVDAAAMPLLHSYWYWGCNSVCHPRYKLNQTWLLSLGEPSIKF